MRHIESILKVSDQGMSRPFLCRDDACCVRWCKGSHTGFRSLGAEWICACLAREIGLPIPPFDIFRLARADFCAWSSVQNAAVPNLVTDFNQYVFGSMNVEGCKDVFEPKADLEHVDSRTLAKIYWFDELIHNTDRTDFNSNLLVNGSVYIIDHNNAFDPEFEKCVFENEHILRGYRDSVSADEVHAIKEKVCGLAQGKFLENAWSEMPDPWIEVCETELPLDLIRNVLLEEGND